MIPLVDSRRVKLPGESSSRQGWPVKRFVKYGSSDNFCRTHVMSGSTPFSYLVSFVSFEMKPETLLCAVVLRMAGNLVMKAGVFGSTRNATGQANTPNKTAIRHSLQRALAQALGCALNAY